jgi:hypothetical protein
MQAACSRPATLNVQSSLFDTTARLSAPQVSAKYANNSGAVPFGGSVGGAAARDGVIDVMVTENLFYNRSISRIYDLKGSERDRYVADNPATAGGRLGR